MGNKHLLWNIPGLSFVTPKRIAIKEALLSFAQLFTSHDPSRSSTSSFASSYTFQDLQHHLFSFIVFKPQDLINQSIWVDGVTVRLPLPTTLLLVSRASLTSLTPLH